MLIITGTGRCGTMWLAKCFHAHHEYHAAIMERAWPDFKVQGSETFNDYPKRLQFMKKLDTVGAGDSMLAGDLPGRAAAAERVHDDAGARGGVAGARRLPAGRLARRR